MQRPLGNKIMRALVQPPLIKTTHEYFMPLNSAGVIIAAGCGRSSDRFSRVICRAGGGGGGKGRIHANDDAAISVAARARARAGRKVSTI